MTCASAMLKDYTAPYTATVVEKLVGKGGCVLGKANLDEFAMGSTNIDSYFGPAKNPKTPREQLDADFFVAGGSSGGCAVAVSEGFADIAIGSDTGGSTRNPASFNGIFGFKPSYGLISRHGLVPLANSFDSPSLFTRTADECIEYFEYTLSRDPRDCTSLDPPPSQEGTLSNGDLSRLKIAVPKEFRYADVSADCEKIWQEAVRLLSSSGAHVEEVSLPHTKHSVACYHILNESDVLSNMARYDSIRFGYHSDDKATSFAQLLTDSRNKAFNSIVRRRIFAGNFFNLEENKGKYFHQAAKIRRLIQRDFEKIFRQDGYDALLLPSTNHSAPTIGQVRAQSMEESRNDDFFTQSANMCGLPAISVPFGHCSNRMPLGMQFICDYLSDRKCLSLGKILHSFVEPSK